MSYKISDQRYRLFEYCSDYGTNIAAEFPITEEVAARAQAFADAMRSLQKEHKKKALLDMMDY